MKDTAAASASGGAPFASGDEATLALRTRNDVPLRGEVGRDFYEPFWDHELSGPVEGGGGWEGG